MRIVCRMPAVLSAGERIHAEVLCANAGWRTWVAGRPGESSVALTHRVCDGRGEVLPIAAATTPVPHDVRRGEHLQLFVPFMAPAEPGDYFVEWSLRGPADASDERDGSTAIVPLRVTPFAQVERGRYPVEVVPVGGSTWSPRFRKPLDAVRVAIAVRTWNVIATGRHECFMATLESLREAGHPFELALVDNGSTDGTAKLVAEQGGHLAARVGMRNQAGYGMTAAIERALVGRPDLVVFSDDDVAWHPGFLRRLVAFWAFAPHDLALLSGFLEPRWWWNTIRGAIECGPVRAIVRETAPGGAWTFPAANWRWIAPLDPGMIADAEACHRLRGSGFRLAQADLATHIGAGHSTWGNETPPGAPLEDHYFQSDPIGTGC